MATIINLLADLTIGEPQTHLNMSVYPLHTPNGHTRGYRTLDEALTSEVLQVSEVSEGGSVPDLVVHNTGDLPVLLVVGEELVGAKQNRVLNTSILVPATSELKIPVSCVEQGRWAYRSRQFSSGDTTGHFKLRKLQTENVTRSLRQDSSRFDARQKAVWGEVSRKISSHHARSDTAALHDMYDQTQSTVNDYLDHFTPPASEGFLVAINGAVVGGELFDHHDTLNDLWKKLIRGYAIDAIEEAQRETRTVGNIVIQQTAKADTQSFIEHAKAATVEVYESVGLGHDIRLSSDDVTGSSLMYDDQVIHTTLFNASS